MQVQTHRMRKSVSCGPGGQGICGNVCTLTFLDPSAPRPTCSSDCPSHSLTLTSTLSHFHQVVPIPVPAAVDDHPTQLAATSAGGGGGTPTIVGSGGIKVVTSNPISLSNPISITNPNKVVRAVAGPPCGLDPQCRSGWTGSAV